MALALAALPGAARAAPCESSHIEGSINCPKGVQALDGTYPDGSFTLRVLFSACERKEPPILDMVQLRSVLDDPNVRVSDVIRCYVGISDDGATP